MYPKERTEELREKSGKVNIDDALTSFLYVLMRDLVPVGQVEKLVVEAVNNPDAEYTNGWLARYAFELAEKITNAKMNNLKNALDRAFEEPKKEVKVVPKVLDEFDYEELKKLEQDIIEVAEQEEKGEETQDELIERVIKDSNESIQQLLNKGHMTEERAEKLRADVLDAVKSIQRPNEISPEELVKEIKEEDKMPKEEAEKMIEKAVEVADKTEPLSESNAEKIMLVEPIEIQMEKKAEDDKKHAEEDKKAEVEYFKFVLDNPDSVREQNPQMSDEDFEQYMEAIKEKIQEQ